MGQLNFGNMVISYEERHSLRAKNLSVTVSKGKVRVNIPKGVTVEQAIKFIESKKDWVFKHMEKHKKLERQIPTKEYVAGEKFPYMGRELLLDTRAQPGKFTTIQLESHTILVSISEDIPKSMWPEVVRDSLLYVYQKQAKKVFTEKLNFNAKIMGLQYNEMRIKEQRTKWGSCSRKGNINLNWKVLMAPNEVIDYLIIHELAHLKHMNHSKEYWLFVASFMPSYKKWQKWLKVNGKLLVI